MYDKWNFECSKGVWNVYSVIKLKEVCYGNAYFRGNASVSQKVDENNRFRKFYGDTVVFNLDDGTKKK